MSIVGVIKGLQLKMNTSKLMNYIGGNMENPSIVAELVMTIILFPLGLKKKSEICLKERP